MIWLLESGKVGFVLTLTLSTKQLYDGSMSFAELLVPQTVIKFPGSGHDVKESPGHGGE
jgi:hypothetical protein